MDAVNTRTLAGYKGHQKPEDVGHQFVSPATHWVRDMVVDAVARGRDSVALARDLKQYLKRRTPAGDFPIMMRRMADAFQRTSPMRRCVSHERR